MTDGAGSWPEQDRIDRWWAANAPLLKREASAERLRVMSQRDALQTFLKTLRGRIVELGVWDKLGDLRMEWNRVEREHT